MRVKAGELHVWRVRLRVPAKLDPTVGESARASRFVTPVLRRRYLRSHAALRDILGSLTRARLEFALHEKGKPYLPGAPELRFNLAHSGEMALVAVSLGVEVGVAVGVKEGVAVGVEVGVKVEVGVGVGVEVGVEVGVAVGVIPTLILTRRALRAMCSNFWGGLLSNLKFTPSIAHVHVHVCKHTTALYCL